MKTRIFKTEEIYKSPIFDGLTLSAKWLVVYCLTNSHLGLTNYHLISDEYISSDTGIPLRELFSLKSEIAHSGIGIRFHKKWIFLPSHLISNFNSGTNKSAYDTELSLVPKDIIDFFCVEDTTMDSTMPSSMGSTMGSTMNTVLVANDVGFYTIGSSSDSTIPSAIPNASFKYKKEDEESKREEESVRGEERKGGEEERKQPSLTSELSTSVLPVFEQFREMRKQKKRAMTELSERLIIKKLQTMSDNPKTQVEILENSIAQGWLGIFPLKPPGSPGYKRTNAFMNPENPDEYYIK